MMTIPYSAEEQRIGLCPLDGQVYIRVGGTRAEVEKALSVIMGLWSLRAESTVAWDTVSDGVGADDPLTASVLMRFRQLKEATIADKGPAPAVDSAGGHTA